MLRRPDSFTFGRQVDTRAPDPPRAHEGESPDRGAVGSCPFRRDRSSTALGELAAAAPLKLRSFVFAASDERFFFLYEYQCRRRTLKSTLHPSIFWEMVKFVALGVLYFSLVLPL